MNGARRITLSATLTVLICFFLPWAEVSCLGFRDSASGMDLARRSDQPLWLIPWLMVLVLLLGLVRAVWDRWVSMFALISTVAGSLSAWLMYGEHQKTGQPAAMLSARMTIWFWLGFASSLAVAAAALGLYMKRPRSP